MADEQIDITLCMIPTCFAFKIPPRESSKGYRAADWTESQIWAGRLRIVERLERIVILLEHKDKDGLFASCCVQNDPAAPSSVEPVSDSSRYFVLRLEDGKGNHVFIGIGFNSRDNAFEFKVTLRDFEKQIEERKSTQDAESSSSHLLKQDFTLKGSISLGGGFLPKSKKTVKSPKSSEISFQNNILPPPGGKTRHTRSKKAVVKQTKDDLLGILPSKSSTNEQ